MPISKRLSNVSRTRSHCSHKVKYRNIIFDFDGTLADTHLAIVKTFQETCRQMGWRVLSDAEVSATIGLELRDGFRAGIPELTDAETDEAAVLYRRIFMDIAQPITVAFQGVVDALSELRQAGCRLAVATSRSHHSLELLADQIGVSQFFELLYGAEEVQNHKPAPDLALKILHDMDVPAEETLVVGDASYDLLMGRGAGCDVCGVTWGNQSREKLGSVNPEYLVDDIRELVNIVLS